MDVAYYVRTASHTKASANNASESPQPIWTKNNTIFQQVCDGRYVCCDVGFAEEEEGGGGILLSFEKNDISVASCVEFLQYFVFAKYCIRC